MHRYLITLLAVITLLSQWGWVEHAYHAHDNGEVCEVCLAANALEHTINPSLPLLPSIAVFVVSEPLPQQLLAQYKFHYYSSRASPASL